MAALTIVFGAVDLPLIIGIVVLIEAAKRLIRLPPKGWALVLILAGFGAAWLKVDLSSSGIKGVLVQGIVYAAAAEFAYQSWRTLTGGLRKGRGE